MSHYKKVEPEMGLRTKPGLSEENKKLTVIIVRACVFLYLLAVTILFGAGTYYLLSAYEQRITNMQYDNFVDDFGSSTVSAYQRILHAAELMSAVTGAACPELSDWPNCHNIDIHLWEDYTDVIVDGNPEIRTMALIPLVVDDQLDSYIDFVHASYNAAGLPHIGVIGNYSGMVGSDENGNLVRQYGAISYGMHNYSAPVYLEGKLAENVDAILFNTYSGPYRVPAFDDMLSCAQMPFTSISDCECGAVTDVFMLIQEEQLRPGALIYYPIFPRNASRTVVGVSAAVFNWDKVMSDHVSVSVEGVECVLTTPQTVSTYTFDDNEVIYVGDGDLHNHRFDHMKRSLTIIDNPEFRTTYQMDVYPTEEFARRRTTNYPMIGCIISVCVIVLTSIVVLIFDRTVAKDAREKELVGETKRLFVRYVSHEIRTPLNTMHLGLVFLHSDIIQVMNSLQELLPKDELAHIASWVGLVEEIEDSADIAVTVLNDLIYYDKISMGSLSLELSEINILEVALLTMKPFHVQAKAKNISLRHSNNLMPDGNDNNGYNELNELVVVGDEVKIAQVIRNLICNALKFTPTGGVVMLSGK